MYIGDSAVGYILVGAILLLILGALYLVHKGRNSKMSVTTMGTDNPDVVGNPIDPVDEVKLNWFHMHFALVCIMEEDGTEAYFVQDKRTKQMVGYVQQDLTVKELKQQGGK